MIDWFRGVEGISIQVLSWWMKVPGILWTVTASQVRLFVLDRQWTGLGQGSVPLQGGRELVPAGRWAESTYNLRATIELMITFLGCGNDIVALYENVFVLMRYVLKLLGVKSCGVYNLLSNNSDQKVYIYKQMWQKWAKR